LFNINLLGARFSVVKNPETGRYTLIKGGNTCFLDNLQKV
jgi:hypothetical protein